MGESVDDHAEVVLPAPGSFGEVLSHCEPQVWHTLLTAHVADRTGHCADCGVPRHPCRLRGYAQQAELAYRRRTARERNRAAGSRGCAGQFESCY